MAGLLGENRNNWSPSVVTKSLPKGGCRGYKKLRNVHHWPNLRCTVRTLQNRELVDWTSWTTTQCWVWLSDCSCSQRTAGSSEAVNTKYLLENSVRGKCQKSGVIYVWLMLWLLEITQCLKLCRAEVKYNTNIPELTFCKMPINNSNPSLEYFDTEENWCFYLRSLDIYDHWTFVSCLGATRHRKHCVRKGYYFAGNFLKWPTQNGHGRTRWTWDLPTLLLWSLTVFWYHGHCMLLAKEQKDHPECNQCKLQKSASLTIRGWVSAMGNLPICGGAINAERNIQVVEQQHMLPWIRTKKSHILLHYNSMALKQQSAGIRLACLQSTSVPHWMMYYKLQKKKTKTPDCQATEGTCQARIPPLKRLALSFHQQKKRFSLCKFQKSAVTSSF